MLEAVKPRNGRWDLPSPVLGLPGHILSVLRTGDSLHAQGTLHLLSLKDNKATSLGLQAVSGFMCFSNSIYHLVYMESDQEEAALFFCSSSVISFQFSPKVVLSPRKSSYTRSWRDPQIVQDKNGWIVYCGALQNGDGLMGRRGCIARFVSSDFLNWQELPPILTDIGLSCAPASPCFYRSHDYEYLLFTSLSDRVGTRYLLRTAGSDLWHFPPNDLLDSRAFLHGRILFSSECVLICGILPTRDCDHWRYRPARYAGHDYNTWDLGGSILFHHLQQASDGTLKLGPAIRYPVEYSISWRPLIGDWCIAPEHLEIDSPNGSAHLISNQILPDRFMLSLDMHYRLPCHRISLALFADEDFTEAYYLYVEPTAGRVQLKTPYRMTENGSWAFPQEVEFEQHYDVSTRYPPISLILHRQGNTVQLWINQSAMSFRIDDRLFGRLGLSISHGSMSLRNFQFLIPEEDIMP